MRFSDPWVLLLIPLVLFLIFAVERRKKSPAFPFPSGDLLTVFRDTLKIKLLKNMVYIRACSVLLIVLALARPQSVAEELKRETEGRDIILAVDLSTSMRAEDLDHGARKKNRLEIAKGVIADFVRERSGDRIGMSVFASDAYAACPLTFDHEWLLQRLGELEAGMIRDGTALGAGMMSAVAGLGEGEGKGKVVILLTDGRNNTGDVAPATAAQAARALGIKIYTIGVGSTGPALYPIEDPFGATVYKEVDAELDEDLLKEIARSTGAAYFRAADAERLAEIYGEIDRLEKRKQEERVFFEYTELFPFLIIAGAALLFGEAVLRTTVLRSVP